MINYRDPLNRGAVPGCAAIPNDTTPRHKWNCLEVICENEVCWQLDLPKYIPKVWVWVSSSNGATEEFVFIKMSSIAKSSTADLRSDHSISKVPTREICKCNLVGRTALKEVLLPTSDCCT